MPLAAAATPLTELAPCAALSVGDGAAPRRDPNARADGATAPASWLAARRVGALGSTETPLTRSSLPPSPVRSERRDGAAHVRRARRPMTEALAHPAHSVSQRLSHRSPPSGPVLTRVSGTLTQRCQDEGAAGGVVVVGGVASGALDVLREMECALRADTVRNRGVGVDVQRPAGPGRPAARWKVRRGGPAAPGRRTAQALAIAGPLWCWPRRSAVELIASPTRQPSSPAPSSASGQP